MVALRGLAAYLVEEIPRRGDAELDKGRGQRLSALVAAYHAGIAPAHAGIGLADGAGGVAFGWVRADVGGPVRVVAAGDALVGSADGESGDVMLSLPAGARGKALVSGELAELVGGLGCWREVAGISDGLLAADGQGGERGAGSGLSLDDGLLGSWSGAFGWLVVAEPVAAAELRGLAEDLGVRQRVAEASADRFPERAVQARRLKERHAELERGGSGGFWRITVLAGGADEVSAARVAGLFCASTDLGGLPYALSPAPVLSPGTAGSTGPTPEPGGEGIPAAPFYGSTELLAALVRPPEAEVPGVRFALRPEFDVTPETPAGGIRLGEVLDRNLLPAGPFTISADSLNRHVFVCGATGAGKSQTVRCLLEAAGERGIPWLVVEPA
jgi:hypothetical protein